MTSRSTSTPSTVAAPTWPGWGRWPPTPASACSWSDSTNAEEPGFTASESTVGATLEKVFLARPDRRFIVTCFASHIHRIQQVADAAIAGGRVLATLGRSMQKNVALARKLDLLHIPDSALVDIEDVDNYPPGRVCVISTGSQGEPMSALSRLATGENRFFKLHEDDVVVISAHPDPRQRVVGRAGHRQPAPPRASR